MKRILVSLFLLFIFFSVSLVSFADQLETIKIETQNPLYLSLEHNQESGEPQGVIYTSAPELSYYIKVDNAADQPYHLKMLLNGEEVPAEYSTSTHHLTYNAHNLSGENKVVIQLYTSDELVFEKKWDFKVDPLPVSPLETEAIHGLKTIQQSALKSVNQYRTLLNLPLFTSNDQLQQAAQAHANYLFKHPDDGHEENQTSNEWFTGYKASDRTGYYGYTGVIGEGITFQEPTGKVAINHLFDAPYHRMSLIDPRFSHMGTGYNQAGDFVANYGGTSLTDETRTITYPVHNQSNVKVSWFAYEFPNPLRFFNKNHLWTGYPISYTYFGRSQDTLNVNTAGLYRKDGTEVPVYKILPSIDDHGDNHVFLIPKEKLLPGVSYQAKIDAKVKRNDGSIKDVSRSWNFTTADELNIEKIYFEKQQSSTFLKLEWGSGEDPNATITLTKDGEVYIEKEGNSQYSHIELESGSYKMRIDSPWFDEIKDYEVVLDTNAARPYIYSSEVVVDSFRSLEEGLSQTPVWGDYSGWASQGSVASDKKWLITFNQPMENVVSGEDIYVVNNNGESVPVTVTRREDKQTFEVSPPVSGYQIGSYQLIIDPFVSTLGVTMVDGIRMNFKVK